MDCHSDNDEQDMSPLSVLWSSAMVRENYELHQDPVVAKCLTGLAVNDCRSDVWLIEWLHSNHITVGIVPLVLGRI